MANSTRTNSTKTNSTRIYSFRRILLLIIGLLLIVLSSTAIYAYFYANIGTIDKTLDIDVLDGNTTVVNITDFEDLFKASKSDIYNDTLLTSNKDQLLDSNNNVISITGMRKVLKLSSDISLETDLIVTADIHLDLNGHTLDLNGHNLTFEHSYSGLFTVYSSNNSGIILVQKPVLVTRVVDDGQGNYSTVTEEVTFTGDIVINTPKAYTYIDTSVLFKSASSTNLQTLTVVDNTSYLDVIEIDRLFITYNALHKVSDVLINEISDRPSILSYKELNALGLVTTPKAIPDSEETIDVYSLTPTMFIPTFEHQYVTNTDNDCASFITQDIDLPVNYLSDDIKIEYESNNQTIIDNRGNTNFNSLNTVNLLAKVMLKENDEYVEIGNCTFKIYTIVRGSNEAALTAKTLLEDILVEYRSTIAGTDYTFTKGINVPKSLDDFGVNYTYTLYKTNGLEASGIVNDKDNTYLLALTSACSTLKLSCTPTNSTVLETTYVITSTDTAYIVTNSTIASETLNRLYGSNSRIVIKSTTTGYSNHLLYEPDETAVSLGVTGITYSLLNNTNSVYQIDDPSPTDISPSDDFTIVKKLVVAPNKHPGEYVQTVILNCAFTFEDGSTEDIQLDILYVDEIGGDNIHAFLPYYTHYCEELYGQIMGYTISGFKLPLCFSSGGPIICYDIYHNGVINPANFPMSISLVIEINQVEYSYAMNVTPGNSYISTQFITETLLSGQVTFTAEDNSTVTLGLADIMTKNPNWVFEANKYTLSNSSMNVELIFNYLLRSTDTNWTTYIYEAEGTYETAKFTLGGILRCRGIDGNIETNAPIIDENLYKWIYDNYNINDDIYTVNDPDSYLNKFVETSWLAQDVTVDNTTGTLTNVTNYNGLEFLDGTRKIVLSGITNSQIADDVAVRISDMKNLEEIDLSGSTAFRDKESTTSADLNTVSSFRNLENLRILNLNGNDCISFEFLTDLSSIEEVRIADNNITGAESIFYGSKGLVNMTVFQTLTDRGVIVYNTSSSGTDVLFTETTDNNDYINLRSIEYQSKVKTGISIASIYNQFSCNPDDYYLEDTYNGTDITSRTISFGYEGNEAAGSETSFTLTYTIVWSGQTVSIKVNFPITRIGGTN